MRRATLLAVVAVVAAVAGCERAPERPATEPAEAPRAADTIAAVSPPRGASAADSLHVVFEKLVRGESGDTATWFSPETAGALRSIAVDSAGHAIVDFRDLRQLIPNASSSAGSAMLLRELNAATFRVGGVASVEYRMDGSCELFGEWLQYGVCLRFDRSDTGP